MTTAEGDRRPPPWTWDELVLACDLVVRNNWRSLTATDQRVQELSDLLQTLPTYPQESRGSKFRNSNGVARKTVDLATNHPDYTGAPTNGGRLDVDVINAFIDNPQGLTGVAAALRQALSEAATIAKQPPDPDLDSDTAAEGRLLERLHLIRERDPRLRARKIADARKHLGQIRCEVCVFDFEQVYGQRGRDYIECHHRKPLSHSGPTRTALADLALLCSNCHRMIHRHRPWLSVDELHEVVARHAAGPDSEE